MLHLTDNLVIHKVLNNEEFTFLTYYIISYYKLLKIANYGTPNQYQGNMYYNYYGYPTAAYAQNENSQTITANVSNPSYAFA